MPKRTDIESILVIGAGPIIISQACEFDYSGTQACKALKQEGYKVILVNSNPATIMTDPEMADSTYIEPVNAEVVAKIIEKERPSALLPTLGGQTGLNTAMKLHEMGILKKYNVKTLAADYDVIKKAEDREHFKRAMIKIGLDVPRSGLAHTMEEALKVAKELGFPLIIRPSFTLGGTGGGIVHNEKEFIEIASRGLRNSMTSEILIEESIVGWKEYELEVMRDKKDNVVIVCSIENLDPMGVHTGDSITVAPQQTLTDSEYQTMRDASIAIIREIGVETGGSNIQFAVNPDNGRMVVIEMNPRVSRSSALASKATGFPIAKFAAKLAVGYTLDELANDITKKTPACFEPTIDYCVVKIPRFTFEKFPKADSTLGISMKSVGETMAIGRTFKEALQKGLRGLETGKTGLNKFKKAVSASQEDLDAFLKRPNAERLFFIREAMERSYSVEKLYELTQIDPWFLNNIKEIIDFEKTLTSELKTKTIESCAKDKETPVILRKAKRMGFSDAQIAEIMNTQETEIKKLREKLGIKAVFKLVDTCAAEFEAYTPYYYSTYEDECEVTRSNRKKIMILGGGPNRIGQGIEFDYCCCHASFALKEMGFETIMVNSNPETVSTDYDTSDKLYFEPLTFEDVMNIVDIEKPDGVIVQFGGQTPLNLAERLDKSGVPIIGTSVKSIAISEDRQLFKELIQKLGLLQPKNDTAKDIEEAIKKSETIGYPVVVRPSFVLGGRAMKIVYNDTALKEFMKLAVEVSPGHPVLLDKFLESAQEVDVDALSDGKDVLVCGIMEHIEEAGIHSGDSACALPPHSLSKKILDEIKRQTILLAESLNIKGLMNIQFAIKDEDIYILEVNPRASRTVPFVSKATNIPLAKIAAKIMAGARLKDFGLNDPMANMNYTCVKESVLPFSRFSGVDIILGPEMLSTGEVMGIANTFGTAFYKSQDGAGQKLPASGKVFISVNKKDKNCIAILAERLIKLGFEIFATDGTAEAISRSGIKISILKKLHEGSPNIMEFIKDGKISLIIDTPSSGAQYYEDSVAIRSAAIMRGIPCVTTIEGAKASISGMEAVKNAEITVNPMQEYYKNRKKIN
ncbi:carbamoyl-phosphate synthase large subunit [Candidatus Omnitrophus magneticus]|uniref:Carbamoyl phosphate synthase large chain n=1 Tax=Candidatus Omnitrophus magneticus TaxID=1609969 RepID=A0A0F0CVK1_9BACT|nr:carbamoyl-phosphate synthase large subunit [Candidatus Omnitrophus magneticus]